MAGKVLLIDDDNTTLLVIEKKLAEAGYEVLTARDGMAGLEMVRAEHPDLVIADLIMPRLGGADFCRSLREHESTRMLPIILLTARGRDEEARAVPADIVLTKPCYPRELLSAMSKLLPAGETPDPAA